MKRLLTAILFVGLLLPALMPEMTALRIGTAIYAATLTYVIDPDGTGDYTSLVLAEIGTAQDLTSGPNILRWECKSSSGGDDTDDVEIDGTTTAANAYIEIVGTDFPADGVWDGSKYNLTTTDEGFPVKIADDYVYIDKIQFQFVQTSTNTSRGLYVSSSSVDVRISNCLIVGSGASTGSNRGAMCYATNTRFWNCVVYGFKSGTDDDYDGIYAGTGAVDLWNCTFNDCRKGLTRAAATTTATNCLIFECDDDFSGTITMTYCASYDDHTGDSATNFVITQTDDDYAALVTDADGRDYSVTDASSELVGAGTDDPGGAYQDNTDITETARSSTWDVGAFEGPSGAPPPSSIPVFLHHYKMMRSQVVPFAIPSAVILLSVILFGRSRRCDA